jgi:hypothetical protein
VWGVFKITLVPANLTDVLPFGRLAAHKNSTGDRLEDASRFPAGVITMAEGSPLVTDDTAIVDAIAAICEEFECYGWRRVRAAL